jgi:hypothetical protein
VGPNLVVKLLLCYFPLCCCSSFKKWSPPYCFLYCTGVSHINGTGSPCLQHLKPFSIAVVICRSVWHVSSHLVKEWICSFQTSVAPDPVQIHIWLASSLFPHHGHLSFSHFFHLAIHFPTPHMPTVCLVMNRCLEHEIPDIALSIKAKFT